MKKLKKLYRRYFPYRKKVVYEIGPKGEFIHMDNMPDSYFMDLDKNLFNIIIQSLEQYKQKMYKSSEDFYMKLHFFVDLDKLNKNDILREKDIVTDDMENKYVDFYKSCIYSVDNKYIDYFDEISMRRVSYICDDMIYFFKNYNLKDENIYNIHYKSNEYENLEDCFDSHIIKYNNGSDTFIKYMNYFWS